MQVDDLRCMVHGHKFAMFKCDSCCAVAIWNCYSNHYCERCHTQAGQAKHYPCPGPGKCPLGIPHPPNQEAAHGEDANASFCIGCTACSGCTELPDELAFEEKNMFGFPDRQWTGFCSGREVLDAVGEEEVRARLKVMEPALVAEQDAFSAELCADWLLPLEISNFEAAQSEAKRAVLEQEEYLKQMEAYAKRMKEERIAMDDEIIAPAPADDCVTLKSSREEIRGKDTTRAATRRGRMIAKAALSLWKRSGAKQQRHQQRGGRHKVEGWDFGLDDFLNTHLVCGRA